MNSRNATVHTQVFFWPAVGDERLPDPVTLNLAHVSQIDFRFERQLLLGQLSLLAMLGV
jgi:hypothetical protein